MKAVDAQLEEILHPVIRSYLLLENAAMAAQSRISIMNMCSNDAVSKALRQSVGNKELMARDQTVRRETFRHVANFGVTAE